MVASRDDIELLVADTLVKGALSHQALSQQFEGIAQSDDAERMIARVAAITGETELQILERTQPCGALPPVLVLAGDTERTRRRNATGSYCGSSRHPTGPQLTCAFPNG